MDEKLEQVKQILKKYGQEQLLDGYNRLPGEKERQDFLNSILTVNFNQIEKLFQSIKEEKNFSDVKIEPIDFVDKEKLSKDEYAKYEQVGVKKIKSGKLAVVTMAGGQGTRLGHTGPKGTYDLGLDTHKSIFEILCDTLNEARARYNVDIPWYIMTSEENNDETEGFFKSHHFFGYPEKCITFFKQGKLPMLDTNGKIILDEKYRVKEAADGHGGIFQSMLKEGVIYDMKARGIEWVFIGGVDNVLAKMVDPILIGLSEETHATAAGKSLVKAGPKERVGVFCKKNGKPSVIEYTEISEEMAAETTDSGELKYGESHILCNMFSINAIEKISKMELPYHVAVKKAKYLDKDGNLINPDKPNAYKFESFLFDAFESLDDMAILRVKREEEFAPVKNAEGVDSPETARKLYIDFHSKNK